MKQFFLNKKRRHSTLNYKTIKEFNNQNKIQSLEGY